MEQSLAKNEGGEYGATTEGATTTVDAKAGVSSMRVRCMYGLFLLFGFALSLVMKNNIIQFISKWMIEHDSACDGTHCIGNQSAYRVSFALFVFFFVHWLLSSNCNLCMSHAQRNAFNKGSFFFKFLAFIPLLIISFVIPNAFFGVYAWIAVIASVFFLLAQLIILLDFSYTWSERWGAEEESRFQVGLLASAIFLYAVGLTIIGLLYHWFGSSQECKIGQGMISATLVCAVLYTFVSVVTAGGSVIPSGTVFVYTVWTCYSALSSGIEPGECNKLAPSGTSQIILAVIFCGISMVYTCVNAATSRGSFACGGGGADEDGQAEEQVDEEEHESSNFAFFHLVMMLGSCYMAMLVTSWEISGTSGTGVAGVDSGAAPMWVKFGTELACILLYIWTLIAPVLCGERDFTS